MPLRFARLAALFAGCFAVAAAEPAAAPAAGAAPSARVARPDPEAAQGVWEGWGTSLAWFAKVLGDRNDVADWLFTLRPEVDVSGHVVPGLGLTIARYNAGACSWVEVDGRRMVVSKIIHPFRQIEAFWLDGKNPDPESASWDWTVDARQRAALLKARDRGANRFELFSNSPPWWMCVNDNPSGGPKGDVENLRRDQREAFAHYLATIARRAKDHWGITFTTVAPFNEPSSSYWFADCKQEGSHFPPSSQAEILPLVRAALDRQGLADMPLSASDETHYDHAVTSWRTYSPEVRALVAQVNVHGYQGARGQRAELHRLVVTEGGKRLWNSEYGDKDADGLGMARNLHRDFHRLKPTAWCYWQPLDGGNKGGWGLMDADLIAGKIGAPNPKLYVLAQYSRHIRSGMTILATGDERAVAAFDASARRLVVVACNDASAPAPFRIDLSAFAARDARVSRWLTETSGRSRYLRLADEAAPGGVFETSLPPASVATFQFEGVAR